MQQWLANWFLQDLDHLIKEKLKAKCFVRYVDDIVIFGRNKKKLHNDLEEIRNYLKSINLEIKDNWQIFRFDFTDLDGVQKGRPVDFMGFKFYRNRTTLRKNILLKASRKAKRINRKGKITWIDACQIMSYAGWFACTNTHNTFLKYIAPFVSIKDCRKLISKKQMKLNKEDIKNECKLETNGKQRIPA